MSKTFSLNFLNSIRGKLIFAFLGVSLVPLMFVTIITQTQTQKNLTALKGQEFQGTARIISTEIEAWVNERKQDVETLASLSSIRSMDSQQANDAIQTYFSEWELYEIIFLADLNGDVIAESAGNRPNIKDRGYFQEAIQGKTAISPLLISRTTGNPVVVFAAPVYQEQKMVGVVGVIVPTTSLSDLLKQGWLGEGNRDHCQRQRRKQRCN